MQALSNELLLLSSEFVSLLLINAIRYRCVDAALCELVDSKPRPAAQLIATASGATAAPVYPPVALVSLPTIRAYTLLDYRRRVKSCETLEMWFCVNEGDLL